jgi:hypothetical protein
MVIALFLVSGCAKDADSDKLIENVTENATDNIIEVMNYSENSNDKLLEENVTSQIHCELTSDCPLTQYCYNNKCVNISSLAWAKSNFTFDNISENELYSCEKNEDCTVITPGCCNCNSAGRAISINIKYVEEWAAYREQLCVRYGCVLEISQHVSCFSQARCVSNKCILVPNIDYLCSFGPLGNCKSFTPEERWDDVERRIGISCRQVMELCE